MKTKRTVTREPPRASVALAPARIPRGAKEIVVARYPSGAKQRTEHRHRGDLVVEVSWEENGNPYCAWRHRAGKRHGPQVEWWENGQVSFIEPWVDGVAHGVARHYDEEGKLLLETRYVRGTGVDLWCDLQSRTLSEETRIEGGNLRERRWWNPDERTVHAEEHYAGGQEHGIFRQWNDRGRLRRGFPRYLVRGERVDKRTYVRMAREDASLPPYRAKDDEPRRKLPVEYVGQPVHRERRPRK